MNRSDITVFSLAASVIWAVYWKAAATSTPQRHDCKLEAGTHLMHLETGRRVLYEAVGRALKGDLS